MEPAGALLTSTELGERFVDALEGEGLEVKLDSGVRERPILATVRRHALRLFLWNATPGGPPGVRERKTSFGSRPPGRAASRF
jgi:hypothetical protein